MVKQPNPSPEIQPGVVVAIPWGSDQIYGRVVQIYGPAARRSAVLELTPELSGLGGDEATTISFPVDLLHAVETA